MFHLQQPLPDQKAIVSAQTLDEMHAPSARQSAHERYGVGWRIYDEVPDLPIVGHSGGMDGVNNLLKMIPSARIAIAILTNTNGNRDLEEQIVEDVLTVLLPTFAKQRAEEREKQKPGQTDGLETDFRPDTHLLGQWHGYVHTCEGDIPLTLWFKETGDVHAQLGTQVKTLINNPLCKEQFFEGMMMGDIGTRDASRYPHHLYLDLKQREGMFTGAIIAMPIREKIPGERLGYALSHWVELRKDHS